MSSQSSGMRYQDFTLQVVPRLAGRYVVYAQCPQGEGKGPFRLPPAWRAGRAPAGPRPGDRLRDLKPRPRQLPGLPESAGERLFEALFPPDVLRLYERSLDEVKKAPGTGLRVKLMIDPDDPELSGLLALPWEELRQPGTPELLALSRWHSIVRYLMVPRPVEAANRPPKLRILTLAASPRGLSTLSLERERRNLEEALRPASGAVEIVEAQRPTLAGLREALRAGEVHVLHFMGHGSFEEDADGGAVYFETEDGGRDPIRGEDLANTLAGFPELRLVVLNSCHSARVSESSEKSGAQLFTGVATSLVMGGLPAVIAMRAPISDNAAIAFSRTFYQRLAAGDPVDAAVVEGRQAIHSNAGERSEWATPALFMRTREGDLFPSESLPPEKYPARPWWPGWLAAALLLVLLSGVVWLACVERFAREGSRFLQQSRFEEAREELSKALVLAPYSADIHLGLAMAESGLGHSEAAEEHFSKAVHLKPHDPKYRFHWGGFLNLRGRYAEAARELTQAIRDDKTYVPAYNELARSEIEQKLWSTARETLSTGLSYARNDDPALSPAPLYDKLGQVDLRQGRLDDAVHHLQAALDRYPRGDARRLETIALLAEAFSLQGNARGVCNAVRSFRALDPQGITPAAPDLERFASLHHCPSEGESP